MGFFSGLLENIAGPIVTGIFGKKGQDSANQANIQVARETNAFNAEQADINRVWSAGQAADARIFNMQEAEKNRDFQEHMANTTYRRAVGDLTAAGLNPMLAYSQGGAPSPSGSQASGPAASSSAASGVRAAEIKSSAQAALAGGQIAQQLINAIKTGDNIDADTALKRAQEDKEVATAQNVRTTTTNVVHQIEETKARTDNLKQDSVLKQSQGNLNQVQEELTRLQKEVAAGTVDKNEAETALIKVNTILRHLERPEAEAMADKFKSKWGHDMSPYIKEIMDILRSVAYSRRSTK